MNSLYHYFHLAIIIVLVIFAAIDVVVAEDLVEICEDSSDCFNDGTCSKLSGNDHNIQFCDCSKAVDEYGTKFTGLNCEREQRPDEDPDHFFNARCDNGKFCVHNGICVHNTCVCKNGFEGKFCESKKSDNNNENSDIPSCYGIYECFNGGVCKNNVCQCAESFMGDFCEFSTSAVTAPAVKRQSGKKSNHAIVFFSISLGFLGIAMILLIMAYTRNQDEGIDELLGEAQKEEVLEERMVEVLTSNKNGSSSNDIIPHAYPEAEKTIADLI